MEKKYLVKGGYVRSRNDGQYHYISTSELCKLYKVDPSECVLWDNLHAHSIWVKHSSKLKVLSPREDGKYPLC